MLGHYTTGLSVRLDRRVTVRSLSFKLRPSLGTGVGEDEGQEVRPGPEGSAMFAMNDVSSKVAYAYAKMEVFTMGAVAMIALCVGYLIIALPEEGFRAAVDELLLIAVGAFVLAQILLLVDLKTINRRSWVLVGIAFLGNLILLGLAPASLRTLFSALAILTGAMAVSYPFPIRRGRTTLYGPEEVRHLSGVRALALAGLAVVVLSVGDLAVHGLVRGNLSDLPVLVARVSVAVISLIVIALFLASRATAGLTRGLVFLAVLDLIPSAYLVVMDVSTGIALGMAFAFPELVIWVAALGVTLGLGEKLTRGKTILGHRA